MLSQSNNEYGRSENVEFESLIPTSKDSSAEESSEIEESSEKKIKEKVEEKEGHDAKWKKTIILVSLSLQWFISCCSFSMIAPFFPQEADSKGVSVATSSLIFAISPLVTFIGSPIIGILIPKAGPKIVLIIGMILEVIANTVFGFVYLIEGKDLFLASCFVIETLSAVGGCATSTSSLAMLTNAFQSNLSTAMGVLEAFGGFGLMAGPPIGGLLYYAGGFMLPFLVVGCIGLLSMCSLWIIFPAINVKKEPTDGKVQLIQALKIPSVVFMATIMICSGSGIGFIDPILQRHLKNTFHLDSLKVGFVFLILSAVYTILAPVLGMLAEKTDTRYAICSGAIICGLSFPLLGPPPLISAIPSALWLNCVALATAGLGLALYVIPSMSDMIASATQYGLASDISTQSAFASIFTATISIGMAIGSSLSGLLVQHFNFAWATTIFGIFHILVGLLAIAFTIFERRSTRYSSSKIKNEEHKDKKPI